MRPPAQRNFVGKCMQIRPTFGAPPGPMPASLTTFAAKLNSDSPMTQACIRGHEKQAIPLHETNRFRNADPSGDYSRHAPAPKLVRRPNVKSRILVQTFE